MNRKDAVRRVALAVAIAIASFAATDVGIANRALGQETSSLINQALDQPVKMQFDTVLPEAMNEIARRTGVRIRAEQAVWDMLPWGQQTNLNATIENQTLRQALDAITRKLGLVMVLKDEALELQPGDSTALLIGPEGGWSDPERTDLIGAGWKGASLGRSVLRAETAVCAARGGAGGQLHRVSCSHVAQQWPIGTFLLSS